jgi:hypothetical protein
MKKLGRILRLVIGAMLLIVALSGCEIFYFLFSDMTVQITTYNTTSIWDIEYKASSVSTWNAVTFKNSSGTELSSITYGDSTRPNVAYFNVAGPGTYDIRVKDVLGGVIDTIYSCACSTEVGSDYDYALTLSSAGKLSFF